MRRRNGKSSFAIAFGFGMIIASCFRGSTVIFVLSVMIIILGISGMRNC